MLLAELSEAAMASFARIAAQPDLPLLSVELRHLGGALRPGPSTGGAVDSLDAEFALFAVGIAPDEAAMRAVRLGVDAVQHAMAPWSTGGCYLNFAERRKAGTALFGDHVHRRLTEVKAAYDPADLVRSNHPVPPAS
jgi:hypothetical protein